MRPLKSLFVLASFLLISANLMAQNYEDAARYYNNPTGSVGANLNTSGAFGLLSYDFQSVVFNPAMSSLFKYSNFSVSINSVYSGSESLYLNTKSSSSESTFGINDLSGVFKLPVYQGSFAISAGYIQTANFNKVFSANGFNTQNSISDYLAQTTDDNIRFIGYNGYATDSIRVNNISTGDLQSALRFTNFAGIDQYIEQMESGQMGEFVINISSEMAKNVFLGASIGIPMSTYSYERTYFEQDLQNLYSTSPFDVNTILASEKVDARGTGVYAKLGLVFKPISWLNLGVSYQSPYDLEVKEDYYYSVFTTYDDGFKPSDSYPYNLDGSFSYTIKNPQVLQFGLAIQDLQGLDAGVTFDYRSFGDLEFKVANEFKAFELTQNRVIRQALKDVFSISAGLSYNFDGIKPQFGVAYEPSKYQNGGYDLMHYSAGLQAQVSEQMLLSFGVQYAQFSESPTLYHTADYGTSPAINVSSSKIVLQVGAQFKF